MLKFFDDDLEISILINILYYYDENSYILDLLEPADFHHHTAREIASSMFKLHQDKIHVDITTVKSDLMTDDLKNAVDAIYNRGPKDIDKTEDYAEMLRTNRLFREATYRAALLNKTMSNEDITTESVIGAFNDAANRISGLGTIRGQAAKDTKSIVSDILKKQKEMIGVKHDGIIGVSTGITEVDTRTSGFGGGDLIIIAGRPSMGKTAFAMNIGTNMSQNATNHGTVEVFSLEMDAPDLLNRVISSESSVSLSCIRRQSLTKQQYESIEAVTSRMDFDKLHIVDNFCNYIEDIMATCRKRHRDGKIIAIIIDYLQLMKSRSLPANTRNDLIIGHFTRELKILAKELNVPVILLSQLNRSLENREDKRPKMSDLRESGSIEQDADIIIFLYRDYVYNKEHVDKTVAEAIFAKVRNGEIGTDDLRFTGENVKFSSRKSPQRRIRAQFDG